MGSSLYFYLRAVVFAAVMVAIIVFCAPIANAGEGNIDKTIAALQFAQKKGAVTAEVWVVTAQRDHTVVKERKIFGIVQNRDDRTEIGILVVDAPDVDIKLATISEVIAALQEMKKAGGSTLSWYSRCLVPTDCARQDRTNCTASPRTKKAMRSLLRLKA